MAKIQYVVVEGSGEFPIDMLRYDACYPAQEIDSARIQNRDDFRRVVLVITEGARLTEGRWKSFLWRVVRTFYASESYEAYSLRDEVLSGR